MRTRADRTEGCRPQGGSIQDPLPGRAQVSKIPNPSFRISQLATQPATQPTKQATTQQPASESASQLWQGRDIRRNRKGLAAQLKTKAELK